MTPIEFAGRGAAAQPPDAPGDLALDTRAATHAALQALVADQESVLLCCSADFSAWPLQQPGFVRQLERWALRDPTRHEALRLLAVDWSDVRLRFPRFAAFRRDFVHLIACRQITASQRRDLPEMACTPTQAVYAYTATWGGGMHCQTPPRVHLLRQRFEEAWQQAVPAFPATVLGL